MTASMFDFEVNTKGKPLPEYIQSYEWITKEYICLFGMHPECCEKQHKQAVSWINTVIASNMSPKGKDLLYESLFSKKDYRLKPKEIESDDKIKKFILSFRSKFMKSQFFMHYIDYHLSL